MNIGVCITFAALCLFGVSECLMCFDCQNIADPNQCRNMTQCTDGQSCFVETFQNNAALLYNMGCLNNQMCSSSGVHPMIGRSMQTRQQFSCHECCSTDNCNNQLCAHKNPATTRVDPCSPSPCVRGSCLIGTGSNAHFFCLCPRDFTGLHCEMVISTTKATAIPIPTTSTTVTTTTSSTTAQTTQTTTSSECIDDQAFDCARLDSIFNVCADVHHAKMTCAKFCGLCQLVEGNWATWGDWSICSVTCDNGTMSRTRTCTNPTPSNGGLNCSGQDVDWKLCTKQLCPVHGNWASWSAWSDCSVSCDVGLRKKTRTCTNPRPDRCGDNCYGDASEYSICQKEPCINPVHGNWSDWSVYSGCSVSCDAGLQTRSRACDNPKPNKYGDECSGVGLEYAVCLNDPCGVRNGGWSSWGAWQSCSVSCGVGKMFRPRTCNNPSPSAYGKTCEGDFKDVDICVNTPCYVVSFNARGLGFNTSTDTVIFPDVIFNEGNAYNANTGMFTAPVDGIYYFSVQLCSGGGDVFYFFIQKKNPTERTPLTGAIAQHTDSSACNSPSASVRLNRTEQVCVTMWPENANRIFAGAFIGTLIQAL